jgi:transcription attenuation protein (tryptophan RNA-binding attenuator protein)
LKRKGLILLINEDNAASDYIAILANEDGVNIIGLTRGKDTKFHHTEKLDKGEVYIAQFTENTSAMKIRGKATIYTKHGIVKAGE